MKIGVINVSIYIYYYEEEKKKKRAMKNIVVKSIGMRTKMIRQDGGSDFNFPQL